MKQKIFLAIAVVILFLLAGWVRSLKAQVAYTDFSCPVCGSDEVLDFGETERGNHSQCFDCKTEFYTEVAQNYE
jgi:transcription elongation factor Elf1